MQRIHQLPVAPEEYAKDVFDRIPDGDIEKTQMAQDERRFVNGLVNYYQPQRVLEVGTHLGGGTVVLMNALEGCLDSHIVSIDIATTCYVNEEIEKKWGDAPPIGIAAKKAFPKYAQGNTSKWKLYTGVDPVDVMDDLGETFDMLILDTAHIHPVETLNFLTVLPYLKRDAVVILHDIAQYCYESFQNPAYACKLLFDTVVADKLLQSGGSSINKGIPNLGAFQLNEDTYTYLDNVFSMLTFPWGMFPNHSADLYLYFLKHYPKEKADQYRKALYLNRLMARPDYTASMLCYLQDMEGWELQMRQRLDDLLPGKHLLIYGGGGACNSVLAFFDNCYYRRPEAIWDIRPARVSPKKEIPVCQPDFDGYANKEDCTVIIALFDSSAYSEVKNRLKQNGFSHTVCYTAIEQLSFDLPPLDTADSGT